MNRKKANKVSSVGEFGLIQMIKSQAVKSSSVVEGIGDDTAVLSVSSSSKLLLTTDMLIEGVHFTKEMDAKAVGSKAMSCSLSDIAAMGGWPKHAVVSLGIPEDTEIDYIKQMYLGMRGVAKRFGTTVVGGDTVRSPYVVINVALTGEIKKSQLVTRKGAKKGDLIFVTGSLGQSFKSGHHLKFRPRLWEAEYLVNKCKPTSMIDLSDGLAGDLGHILTLNKVGAVLSEEKIPRRNKATLEEALYDGEDYELLFTLAPKMVDKIQRSRTAKYPFFVIGEIVDDSKTFKVVNEKGVETKVEKKGFSHF